MKRFHLTIRASKDLRAIWHRIAEDGGPRLADRVIADFYDTIQLIAENPLMGHTRADVPSHRYRFWSVYKFVIAYRIDCKPLTISRVIHGACDFKKLFK